MRDLITSLMLASSLLAIGPAWAGDSAQVPPASDSVLITVGAVSLDEAVDIVRSRFGGRVLKAETRYRDGRAIHHVKILTSDGRVRTVRVDGETGRILG